MEFGPTSITSLADLIAPKEEEDLSDDDTPSNYYAKLTPASIGSAKKPERAEAAETGKTLSSRQKDFNDIWDTDEVTTGSEYDDIHDTRPAPDYDITYKQSVGAEDLFLGMSNKTPATSSCEDIVISVSLPGCRFQDVNVDLTTKHLSVRCPKYKLGLHLPHPCDSNNSKAQWMSDKEVLKITARMKREYDFVNF